MKNAVARTTRAKKRAKARKPLPPSVFGPSWSEMTERQRELYPSLPQEEMDSLWRDERDERARG